MQRGFFCTSLYSLLTPPPLFSSSFPFSNQLVVAFGLHPKPSSRGTDFFFSTKFLRQGLNGDADFPQSRGAECKLSFPLNASWRDGFFLDSRVGRTLFVRISYLGLWAGRPWTLQLVPSLSIPSILFGIERAYLFNGIDSWSMPLPFIVKSLSLRIEGAALFDPAGTLPPFSFFRLSLPMMRFSLDTQ